MDTKQEIFRRYFREFDSIRKIARDLKINRDTVRKQLYEHAQAEKESLTGDSTKALQEFLSNPPKYDTHSRQRRKLTVELEDLITEQLEENQRKRQQGLRKQIKRKIDIHQALIREGHSIGYTTICNVTTFVPKQCNIRRRLSGKNTFRAKNASLTGPRLSCGSMEFLNDCT